MMYRFGSNRRKALKESRVLDSGMSLRLKHVLIGHVHAGPSWSSTTSEAAVASVSEACKQLVKNLAPHTQVTPLLLISSYQVSAISRVKMHICADGLAFRHARCCVCQAA